MEKSLLGGAIGIGTKNYFPGPRGRACERVRIDEQRVIDSVELHGFPDRRLDHLGMAEYMSGMVSDGGSLIEPPDFRATCSCCLADCEQTH
jgi:hypothetical protein